jgi:hypothetical protein
LEAKEVANKSKMFKGLTSSDLNVNFKMDVASLAQLPAGSAVALADLLVQDSKALTPTASVDVSKEVGKRLAVSSELAASLTRAGRSLANRLGRADDDPVLIADDLVETQVVLEANKKVLTQFLSGLRSHRADLTGRANRLAVITGGGYHLANWSVFTDYRLSFDRYDIGDVDLDTYKPTIAGLIPVITLELNLHMGEEEKSIAVRLSEPDLVKLEQSLRVARLQLTAAKERFPGDF